MNSRFSTESTGMDAKDYLDIDTRLSMSYLELEHRPTDSYLELDDRPLKAYLEKESNAKYSHFNEQTNPEDSNLESKSRPPDPHLGLDSKPYLDLPDECKLIPTSQPTKCWIPGTNVYDTYYDDTVNFQNSPAQNGVSNQPPTCSSYPNPNPLPLNGTGRQGQALPAPPREAGLRTLESFNTKCMYNTMVSRPNRSLQTDNLHFTWHKFSVNLLLYCKSIFFFDGPSHYLQSDRIITYRAIHKARHVVFYQLDPSLSYHKLSHIS